jgi:hypothetical protein
MSLKSLQNLTRRLFRELEWATALEAKIEGVKSVSLKSFVGGQAGYILAILNKAVLREMIMTACRLFDDGAGNRESLVKAFHLLRIPDVRAELIKSEGKRLKFQHGMEVEEQLSALERKWKACRKNNELALVKLRSARDGMLAHLLDKTSAPGPIYNDLFGVLSSARDVVSDLASIVGTNSYGFRTCQRIWKKRADEYWDVLVTGATAVSEKAAAHKKLKRSRSKTG